MGNLSSNIKDLTNEHRVLLTKHLDLLNEVQNLQNDYLNALKEINKYMNFIKDHNLGVAFVDWRKSTELIKTIDSKE